MEVFLKPLKELSEYETLVKSTGKPGAVREGTHEDATYWRQ